MMQKTFTATELEMNRVFSNDYLFVMPPHQRPYSWTTEETDELLRDLLVAMDDDDEAYFLGSIVLIRNSASMAYQVIDGQQRLTTLTMLFCVLRELAEDYESKNSLDEYVRESANRFAGSQERFRLTIRDRDKDFFRENVQEIGRLESFVSRTARQFTDSQQRIFENAKSLWDSLKEKDAELRDSLSKFIVQKCYIVVVTASDRNSAHRIFSVLNARGMNLEATDILKADVFSEVAESQAIQYTQKWEDIEDDLGREDFQNFFAHLYVIHTKDRHHRELAEAFKEEILDALAKGNQSGVVFIDQVLDPYASAYKVVSKAEYEGSGDINLYLRYLGLIDNKDWIPSTMLFYNSNRDNGVAFQRFLVDFERLAYTLFIRRVRRDPRINRYAKVISAIKNESDLHGGDGPFAISSEDKSATIAALDGVIYQDQAWRFTVPLLQRLNNMISDPPLYEFPKVTVEHVLPQNPDEGSEWLEWFANADVRADWTHKLANLVLLSGRKNSQAQNLPFDQKKEQYFKRDGKRTPYVLTEQVLDESEWTPKVLTRRQKNLIGILKAEWRLT